MSINFNQPPNDETIRMMEEMFGKPVASDGMTSLFDKLPEIESRLMKALTNSAGQPVTTELNVIGDIKTMEDGTQWRLTPAGWHKILV